MITKYLSWEEFGFVGGSLGHQCYDLGYAFAEAQLAQHAQQQAGASAAAAAAPGQADAQQVCQLLETGSRNLVVFESAPQHH
eukprot:4267383-Amphidinium_carterae.1